MTNETPAEKTGKLEGAAGAIRRVVSFVMILGAVTLIAVMVLIMIRIVLRFTGGSLPGTFDLTQLMVVIPAAFALGYAALHKRHVVVNILVSRFPQRARAAAAIFASLVPLAFWGVMAWATYDFAIKLARRDVTEVLRIPYQPFRLLLAFGLVLVCVVYLSDLFIALRQAVKK